MSENYCTEPHFWYNQQLKILASLKTSKIMKKATFSHDN